MSKILGLDQHNIRLDMLQDLVLHWHVYYGWNENPKKWQDMKITPKKIRGQPN